ncbi:MAG: response regulator [Polyangiales bacterium]
MIRALFVDDEPAVLEGLENRLRRLKGRWKLSFANNGEQALQKLAAEPFDVVVTDMRMPGIDGAELLERVRADYPGIVRIVLSGETKKQPMLVTLPAAHQVLSKPCDAQVLEAAVERARALQGLLDDEAVRRAIGGISQLPPLPKLFLELTHMLQKSDVRLRDVAGIIEQEPALTARILQFANSAFMGLQRTVTSAQDAVTVLGLNTLRSLVLSIDLFNSLERKRTAAGFSMSHVHEHSLATARIALSLLGDQADRKTLFSAAVLHDIGTVVLATSLPDFYPPVLERARSEKIPLHVAERLVHGFSHAEAGGYLLALWGLPFPIVEAVTHHHHPSRSQEQTFLTVGGLHVADRICHDMTRPPTGESFETNHQAWLDLPYLDRVGVRKRLDVYRAIIGTEAQQK